MFLNIGSKYFISNTKDNLGKFDSKTNDNIFLGYFSISKATKIYNHRTLVVEESMHAVFDEFNPFDHKKEKYWYRCCF
jgi:hypothetical protein